MASRDSAKTCSATCSDGSECNAWAVEGKDVCYHHGGASTGAPENNANNTSHWLHSSAETFFEHADESHLDTYYAMHESLCDQYETLHGHLPESIKKDLAEIAFEMAKLDMAKEYQAENAVDPEIPLTEKEEQMTEQGVWRKEVISRVETLKTNIRRENRLALKDMGIYRSPEAQQAQATRELGDVVAEALEPQD